MPITAKQKKRRRHYIGSSDCAALLGLDPWKTPIDVWFAKVYETEDIRDTRAMERGSYLEEGLLRWAAHRLGQVKITRNQFRVADNGIFACHLDAIIRTKKGEHAREAIEARTTSLVDEWGEEVTDQIPGYVRVQCQEQMMCDPHIERIHVAVLMPGPKSIDMKMYLVERDDKVIGMIEQHGLEFWNSHVLTRIPPETTSVPDMRILKAIKREPEKLVEIDEKLVASWQTACEYRLNAEKSENGFKALVIAALGDAEGALLPDGSLITFMEEARHTRQREACVSTYRKLKIRKNARCRDAFETRLYR